MLGIGLNQKTLQLNKMKVSIHRKYSSSNKN